MEFGLEPEAVIKATHGRRASDNLQDLIPNLRKEHIDLEVESKRIHELIRRPLTWHYRV